MKQVAFCQLDIADFKAFTGRHSISLDLPGVTFVCGDNLTATRLGSNGAAKSTLWDALCWCLYGSTPGGLKNPDVMPWSESGSPLVSVVVDVDGKSHTIARKAHPNWLMIDDKNASQEAVEELLGMSLSIMINTILLAQGEPLFLDRTPKEKMVLFSDTLRLDRWDQRAEAASAAADEAELDVASYESKKQTCDGTIKELDDLLADAKEQAEAWAADWRLRVRDSTKRRTELQAALEKKEQALGGVVLKEDGAEVELKSLSKEIAKLTTELAEAQTALRTAELRLEGKKKILKEQKEHLHHFTKAKTCPTCGQAVKPQNLEKHTAELRASIEELTADVGGGVPMKVINAVALFKQRLTSAEGYARTFQATSDSARDEMRRLQPDVAALKAELAQHQRTMKSGESEQNPHTQQIATLKERRARLKKESETLDKDIATATRMAERNKFWIKGFKDIKLQLIDDVLEELELVTNSMIEEVGLVGWEMRYGVERETKSGTVQRALNVQISSPKSKGFVRWESWSGGERQRLRLIGALALSDVLLSHAGVQPNLEIFDEPALYWSTEGVQELCAFLAERARATKRSIFYIEHTAVESAHFSNVLTVVQDNKGAYIQLEGE